MDPLLCDPEDFPQPCPDAVPAGESFMTPPPSANSRIEEGEVLVQDGTLGNPENAFSETDSV